MTHSRQLLSQILRKIRENHHSKLTNLVVFDLDSTLFDVSPRLLKILQDFATIKDNQLRFPEQIVHFNKINTLRTDWGIKDALIRAGLDGHHPEFEKAVKKFWIENFFSNHYLKYDLPYEGAIDFVKATARAGAEIVYLTGRDVERMGQGSEDTLLRWGFPLDHQKFSLKLKPHYSMDDADFKKNWFLEKLKSGYENIWFFENEPVNVNLIHQCAPTVNIIFLDTTHAGKAEPPPNIPKIMDFLFDPHHSDINESTSKKKSD